MRKRLAPVNGRRVNTLVLRHSALTRVKKWIAGMSGSGRTS